MRRSVSNSKSPRLRDLARLFVLFAECEARSLEDEFDDDDDDDGEDDDENARLRRRVAWRGVAAPDLSLSLSVL